MSLFKKLQLLGWGGVLLSPFISLAQNSYQTLAPIQGYIESSTDASNFSLYLNNMFKLGVAVATGLAVIMIVIGGIEYMSTDAISGKSEGRAKIASALWGLLIALISFVLLQTINPDLLKTSLKVQDAYGPTFNPPSQIGQLRDVTIPISPGAYGPGGVVGATGAGGGYSTDTDEDGNTFYYYNNGYSAVRYSDNTYAIFDTDGNEVTGQTIPANLIAIDTDGRTDPGIDPLTHRNCTSYTPNGQCLDATTDYYVAVPTSSGIPMGTPVLIRNITTGQSVWGVAGDNGASGWGEMSLAAAQAVGAQNGNGDSAHTNHQVTFTFYGNCPNCH